MKDCHLLCDVEARQGCAEPYQSYIARETWYLIHGLEKKGRKKVVAFPMVVLTSYDAQGIRAPAFHISDMGYSQVVARRVPMKVERHPTNI